MKYLLRFLNFLIRFYKENRPDPLLKLFFVIINLSAAMIIAGGFSWVFSADTGDQSYKVEFTNKDISAWSSIFGAILFVFSSIFYYLRAQTLESKFKTALFFYPGFMQINRTPPTYALPPKDKHALPVDIAPFDSYDTSKICSKLERISEDLAEKNTLSTINKGYFAAIGSIPFLYGLGVVFSDGRISHLMLRHIKNENRWELLDEFEEESTELIYQVGNTEYNDFQEAVKAVKPNENKEMALAISFTQEIFNEHLPNKFQSNNVIHVRFKNGYQHEAIISNQGLDKIALKIHDLQTKMSSRSSEINIFISAQASFVLRLGMCYQSGMSGKVSVFNFNSSTNSYPWGITVDVDKTFKIHST